MLNHFTLWVFLLLGFHVDEVELAAMSLYSSSPFTKVVPVDDVELAAPGTIDRHDYIAKPPSPSKETAALK